MTEEKKSKIRKTITGIQLALAAVLVVYLITELQQKTATR